MKGYFGVFGFNDKKILPYISKFRSQFDNPLPKAISENNDFFLLDWDGKRNTKLEENFPDLIFAGWVRLDNRKELLPKLGLTDTASDEECILKAFLQFGEYVVEHLIGEFSFVIWDSQKQRLLLAKDQIGIRPLFYLKMEDVFIFSTSISMIKKAMPFSLQLNEEYIAIQLKYFIPSVEQTFFKDIYRLKPAHYIYTDGLDFEEKMYWELKALNLPKSKDKKFYYQMVRDQLEEAIRCRIRGKSRVGTQLSGGMDSSAITVLLSRMMDKRNLHTYSFVLDEESWKFSKTKIDEKDTQQTIIDYAGLFPANHHTIKKFHYKDIFEELEVRNEVMGGLADSDSNWQDSLFKYAAENEQIEVMFSGFPGDEGISTYGHFFFYDYIDQKKFWEILVYLFEFRIGGLKNVLNYLKYKKHGSYFPGYNSIQAERNLLKDDSQYHQKLIDFTFPFSSSFKEHIKNHILGPHITLRAESEASYANRHGVETVYPLADIRLIQLLYSLPVELYKPKPYSRALFRNVCKGILPDKVRLQYKYNYAYTLAFYDYYSKMKIEALKDYEIQNHTGLMMDPETFLYGPNKHGEDKEDRLAVMKEIDYLIGLNWPE